MIEVCSLPVIDQEPGGDYQLCFWVLEVFNYNTPFRDMLVEATVALGADPGRDLDLPDYCEDEDFIEGSLALGTDVLRVYFEHARSYLSISHPNKHVMAGVLERVRPCIRLRS